MPDRPTFRPGRDGRAVRRRYASLHDRLTPVRASLEPTAQVTRQVSTLIMVVTLQSFARTLEKGLATAEFVVLLVSRRDGRPQYQIEIHLGGANTQTLLRPGVA